MGAASMPRCASMFVMIGINRNVNSTRTAL
jgi:hypothetical protein